VTSILPLGLTNYPRSILLQIPFQSLPQTHCFTTHLETHKYNGRLKVSTNERWSKKSVEVEWQVSSH